MLPIVLSERQQLALLMRDNQDQSHNDPQQTQPTHGTPVKLSKDKKASSKQLLPPPVWTPHGFSTWSVNKQNAWNQIRSDPTVFYYWYSPPGVVECDANVEFTPLEVAQFKSLLTTRIQPSDPHNAQTFAYLSMHLPGRPGYQLHKYYCLNLQNNPKHPSYLLKSLPAEIKKYVPSPEFGPATVSAQTSKKSTPTKSGLVEELCSDESLASNISSNVDVLSPLSYVIKAQLDQNSSAAQSTTLSTKAKQTIAQAPAPILTAASSNRKITLGAKPTLVTLKQKKVTSSVNPTPPAIVSDLPSLSSSLTPINDVKTPVQKPTITPKVPQNTIELTSKILQTPVKIPSLPSAAQRCEKIAPKCSKMRDYNDDILSNPSPQKTDVVEIPTPIKLTASTMDISIEIETNQVISTTFFTPQKNLQQFIKVEDFMDSASEFEEKLKIEAPIIKNIQKSPQIALEATFTPKNISCPPEVIKQPQQQEHMAPASRNDAFLSQLDSILSEDADGINLFDLPQPSKLRQSSHQSFIRALSQNLIASSSTTKHFSFKPVTQQIKNFETQKNNPVLPYTNIHVDFPNQVHNPICSRYPNASEFVQLGQLNTGLYTKISDLPYNPSPYGNDDNISILKRKSSVLPPFNVSATQRFRANDNAILYNQAKLLANAQRIVAVGNHARVTTNKPLQAHRSLVKYSGNNGSLYYDTDVSSFML